MVYVLGMPPSQALRLSIFIHTGTLLSATLYFRREIRDLLRLVAGDRSKPEDIRLLTFLFLATMLTGLVGLPLYLLVKSAISEWLFIVLTGSALIATGLIQRVSQVSGTRETRDLAPPDGLLTGLLQGLSALPGVSRSGMTLTALLVRGFKADEALRLSFILSIPAVALAELGTLVTDGFPAVDASSVLLALVFSFVSSLACMQLLLQIARRFRFWALCITLGIVSLLPLVLKP